jgi:hypothetical protein
VDYVYLQVNAAFEKHTGLRGRDVLGKRATEVAQWRGVAPFLEVYGRVAMAGGSATKKSETSLEERIANAKTIEELESLEKLINKE